MLALSKILKNNPQWLLFYNLSLPWTKIIYIVIFSLTAHCSPLFSPTAPDTTTQPKETPKDTEEAASSSSSTLFIINRTNKDIVVKSSRTRKVMKKGECLSFSKAVLSQLILQPSHCSWYCPPELLGCLKCPSQPGYYEFAERQEPGDPAANKLSNSPPDNRECSPF